MSFPPAIVLFGPVGSGKTTVCEHLSKLIKHSVALVEPVDAVRGHPLSLLYQRSVGAAGRVQRLFFFHRMSQYEHAQAAVRAQERVSYFVLDGHVFTDRLIYNEYYHRPRSNMSRTELVQYREAELLFGNNMLAPRVFVRLVVDPHICYARLNARGRVEEKRVPLEFCYDNGQAVQRTADTLRKGKYEVVDVDANFLTPEQVADTIFRRFRCRPVRPRRHTL